jgi:hypothetical protein
MKQVLEDEGRRLGLALIWSEPVTSHVFSQRADEASGARVCGVSFAAEPRSMHANAMRTAPQRGSCMLYIKYLVPPSPAVVYVPPHHRGMLERIYAHLGTAADVRTSGRTEGCSRVAVSLDRIWGIGTVRVLQAGAAASIEIRQALHDLVDTAGVEVVYLDLPLAQPGTADLCVAAESEGFFFAGVAPLFAPDGDVLRLAYLSGAFDPELLQVASPMGQELVAYAARERKRVTSVCGGEMLSS